MISRYQSTRRVQGILRSRYIRSNIELFTSELDAYHQTHFPDPKVLNIYFCHKLRSRGTREEKLHHEALGNNGDPVTADKND
jgi:hypothetical protein